MPTMNIKDPEVHRLARRLAAQRGVSATRAVREALEEALEAHGADRRGVADRLLALGRRSADISAPVLTDDELYDEHGLPR